MTKETFTKDKWGHIFLKVRKGILLYNSYFRFFFGGSTVEGTLFLYLHKLLVSDTSYK